VVVFIQRKNVSLTKAAAAYRHFEVIATGFIGDDVLQTGFAITE
jgi:hypothetical protein